MSMGLSMGDNPMDKKPPMMSMGGPPTMSMGGPPMMSMGGPPMMSMGGPPMMSMGGPPTMSMGGPPMMFMGMGGPMGGETELEPPENVNTNPAFLENKKE